MSQSSDWSCLIIDRIFEPYGLIPLSEADNSDKDGFSHTRPFGNALLVLVERHLATHGSFVDTDVRKLQHFGIGPTLFEGIPV